MSCMAGTQSRCRRAWSSQQQTMPGPRRGEGGGKGGQGGPRGERRGVEGRRRQTKRGNRGERRQGATSTHELCPCTAERHATESAFAKTPWTCETTKPFSHNERLTRASRASSEVGVGNRLAGLNR